MRRQLQKIFQSDAAEFIAIYGRRRVGKTFLIREFFDNRPTMYSEEIIASYATLGDLFKAL
jgi:AAA+ ATPase superfamily predicted ATPase